MPPNNNNNNNNNNNSNTSSDTYSVWLASATFTQGPAEGFSKGDFRFMLSINNAPQAQLSLSVEAQTTSPTSLIQQAQQELQTALSSWMGALNNN
ncbi:hypothetical protein JY651_43535 [Pyxidicoccus parkwayensis]|uniref:Lipoprotein n=1 Tax=Pyxidicoccus parkwayensis TaxID=2813578 RepID=A0ABX7NST7_9BACT|nr:hypothetical protein [Pyxidicoccus parkwaysis]QSQ21947.1 hypothetical protein JY651_43535 [Pyxidicoccus parkwaysis]